MKGGEEYSGDQEEGPGKKGEEDNEKEITHLDVHACIAPNLRHEAGLRGFVFLRAPGVRVPGRRTYAEAELHEG